MPNARARRSRTEKALRELGAEALISTHAIQVAVEHIQHSRDKPMEADKVYNQIRRFKEPAIEAAVMAATAQAGAIPGVKALPVAVPQLYHAVLRLGIYVWKVVSSAAATYRALLILPERERSDTGRHFQQTSAVTAVAAEALASSIGLPEPSCDVFFQIGLLHDLGLLALWAVNEKVTGDKTQKKAHAEKMDAYFNGQVPSQDYLQYETQVFGMNHCEAAACVFEELKFIQDYSICMLEHHGNSVPERAAAEVLVFRIAHGLSCLAKYATQGLFAPKAAPPPYVGELRRDITGDIARLLKLDTITIRNPIDAWIDNIAFAIEKDGFCRDLFGDGLHEKMTDFKDAAKRLLAPLGLQQLLGNANPEDTQDPAPAFVKKHASLLARFLKEPGKILFENLPLAPDRKLVPVDAAHLATDTALTLFRLGPSKGPIFSGGGNLEPSVQFIVDSLEHSLKSVRFHGVVLEGRTIRPARLKGFFVVGERFSEGEEEPLRIQHEFGPMIQFISYTDLAQ